jgi:hypothetical protein
MNTLLELLQNRNTFLNRIESGEANYSLIWKLLLISTIFFGIYGFIIGLSHSLPQALSAMVKLPVLYILTSLICFPTLFIFNSLSGSKMTIFQTLSYLSIGNCIIAAVMLAFAPVTLFFLISSDHYQFYKILNVVFFAVSGFAGVRIVYRSMVPKKKHISQNHNAQEQTSTTTDSEKSDIPVSNQVKTADSTGAHTGILKFWVLLFAFVGSQLAWTLRPFFGSPDIPFSIFREVGGNFYQNILQSIGHVLGFH